jgi:ATP-dependent Clp protease ATP-binding subunit ClpA
VRDADKITTITAEMIQQEVSKVAHIPEETVQAGEREKLMNLIKVLHERVVGQDDALETLVDAVMISRADLREDNKTAGAFLFTGPTGVGKTVVARALADTLGIPLVKFDMSEYMESHSVSKLIGTAPGYVGYGEGGAGSGLLVNAIEKSPHCVLLMDEFEKAHPDIFNVFLQVFDDGKITSSSGKTVFFNNVIVILTSNAGASQAAKPALGFTMESRADEDKTIINSTFTPEFRNRLDANVRFNALKRENMLMIVKKFTKQIVDKLADRGITMTFTDAAYELLADKGYDPQMGARPLARLIADKVKKPLAKTLIFDQLANGSSVHVSIENGEIKLISHQAVAQAA